MLHEWVWFAFSAGSGVTFLAASGLLFADSGFTFLQGLVYFSVGSDLLFGLVWFTFSAGFAPDDQSGFLVSSLQRLPESCTPSEINSGEKTV